MTTVSDNAEPWMQELWSLADELQISDDVIPRNAASLEQLTELRLESLTADADELIKLISKLPNLKILDLTEYSGESLPEEIFELTSLEQLILESTLLKKLPNKIYELKNLSVLNLSQNYDLAFLPEAISQFKNLKSLNLDGCYEIQTFPNDFFQLTQLEELLLYNTELYSDEIGTLKKLKKLSISKYFYRIPDWIFDLTELTYLCLNEVNLLEVDSKIGRLTNLEYLDLGFNGLTQLPESFGNLTKLKHLSLLCCSLQSLPDSLVNLTQLERLDLSPSDMNTLKHLSPAVTEFLTQLGDVVHGWKKKKEVQETVNLDDVNVSELEQEIIATLDKIIMGNIDHFKKEGDFKVRPDYGYAKFYLDWVDGAYDMSLLSLIHYIMYEDGIYNKILNKSQYARLLDVIDEYPESIFSADEDIDENYSQLQDDFLDNLYYTSMKFVFKKLTSLGFDVSRAFSEAGVVLDDVEHDEDHYEHHDENYEDHDSEADDAASDIDASASFEIIEPVLIIRINLEDSDNITAQNLYNATRSAWKVNLERASNVEYVLSVHQGVVKEVYQVSGWYDAGTTFVPKREDIIGSGRFEFVGTIAEDSIRDKYLNASVKHLFKKGNAQPVMYFNC